MMLVQYLQSVIGNLHMWRAEGVICGFSTASEGGAPIPELFKGQL